MFMNVCGNGHLEVAKWLLKSDPSIDIHFRNDGAFNLACTYGRLEVAKWLWQLDLNVDLHANNDNAFEKACENGHLEIAEWLLQLDLNPDVQVEEEFISKEGSVSEENLKLAICLYKSNPNIDIHENDGNAFKSACINGHLEPAKWLYQLDSNIDIHANNEYIFRHVCDLGHLELAMWLLKLDPTTINIHAKNEYAFIETCGSGHLKTAKWLWQLDSNIGIVALNSAFLGACEGNSLKVAKWLWKLDPNIDVHSNNGYAFQHSCHMEGDIKIAKWLYQINPNIDIRTRKDEIFRCVCMIHDLEKASWLCTLCPDYLIEIKNGKIVKYEIINNNLELITNGKYDQVISKLKIPSVSTSDKNECLVCHEEHSKIIKLPCGHMCCLYSIIKFLDVNGTSLTSCHYCTKQYQWNQCVSLTTEL